MQDIPSELIQSDDEEIPFAYSRTCNYSLTRGHEIIIVIIIRAEFDTSEYNSCFLEVGLKCFLNEGV